MSDVERLTDRIQEAILDLDSRQLMAEAQGYYSAEWRRWTTREIAEDIARQLEAAAPVADEAGLREESAPETLRVIARYLDDRDDHWEAGRNADLPSVPAKAERWAQTKLREIAAALAARPEEPPKDRTPDQIADDLDAMAPGNFV